MPLTRASETVSHWSFMLSSYTKGFSKVGHGPQSSAASACLWHRLLGWQMTWPQIQKDIEAWWVPGIRADVMTDSELIAGSLTLTSAEMDVNMEGKTQQPFWWRTALGQRQRIKNVFCIYLKQMNGIRWKISVSACSDLRPANLHLIPISCVHWRKWE